MSERNILVLLNDISKCINKIQQYVKDKSYSEFINDDLLIDGVIRNLEVIGEAVKKNTTNI